MNNKMKKIGILTFHKSINNGAVMQAYSLSKRLQKENPDCVVEIIDYHMPKLVEAYHYTFWKEIASDNLKLFVKRLAKQILNLGYNKKMNKRVEVFNGCQKMLPLSTVSLLDDKTDELFSYINNNYDLIVVGSDAVWNYILRGFPNAYFPDEKVVVKKMSYAASCYGMDFFKCPEEERIQVGKILQDFSFLGVRDLATENFVKWSGCNKQPVHVCDPTVFLDVDDLPIDVVNLEKKLRKKGFDFKRPTIGIMGNEKMLKMIRRLYGKKYQIASLYVPLKGADVELYDLTPYEWAYVFRYFKLTFTTYFHGTLLSLRNGVPVICISLKTDFGKTHVPKTLDVLKRLGYESCYFETDYIQENVKGIKQKADELLQRDMKYDIIQSMEHEARTFDEFQKELSLLLKENEND